jgi:hypothetical protein
MRCDAPFGSWGSRPTRPFGRSGSNPSRARTSSSGAAAAQACGEHDAGYGMGRVRSAGVRPLRSSGSRKSDAADVERS